ncbi:MEDS domain-containing protein [Actinomadura litoris]|uniref:MEDS domain-containing protein n=1 Tax=Actinomadura litoris TaxID=2678616 RepID=UPI001FA6D9BB|nr:MEDS domain-containing protein [Actinomadura litoris]
METLWSIHRPVRDLRPGDHACLFYGGEDEQRHITGAFVRDGLLAQEKVVYLAGSVGDAVPGVPADAPAGTLTFLPAGPREGGTFDPAAAVAAAAAEIDRAAREGYRAIRVAADLTRALRSPAGLERVLYFERHLERTVPPSTQVMALCQFDRRRCNPGEPDALGEGHTVFAAPDPEFEDAVLRIVRTFRPAGLALSGELDASRHTVLDRELTASASRAGGGDLHLDLARLDFIDLGAINILAAIAASREGPGGIVLDRVSPQLRAVLETVGWDMLPGLRLGRT